MTFRSRLTIVSTAAVAVAVVLASTVGYLVVRHQLLGQLDAALRSRLRAVSYEVQPGGIRITVPGIPLGGASGHVQIVDSNGNVTLPQGESEALPVSRRAREAAAAGGSPFFEDDLVHGTHVRVLTAPVEGGLAVQVGRPLDEVDRSLHRLGLILIVVAILGVALAAGLGTLVARAAMRPVRRLTEATEHVTSTSDLSRRIDADGNDELARLASSFNAMLQALDDSLRAQRQLVADASHELRTPLTSLRTNIEVLSKGNGLSDDQRRALLADVIGEIDQLTALVSDLVELARGTEPPAHVEEVRLDDVVEQAVLRAQKRAPSLRFVSAMEPTLVRGVPERLDRAVSNLLDNAAKWSPSEGEVEVTVKSGELLVRDHGPGIDEADLPHVFDRFYRAPSARGKPGSGLGLAIVRQVAESHGGTVTAEAADGGGALFRLHLPLAA
jgi:two-component system, OmpR family, sensor histidine kinase MprB